jgi:hypothetical protein
MRSKERLTCVIKNESLIVIIKNLYISVITIRKSIASLQKFGVGIKTGK